MRLQTERTPDAAYRRRAQPTRLGHRARAPMRSTCRDRLQGLHRPHRSTSIVPNRAWRYRFQAARPPNHRSRRAETAAATCRRYHGWCPVRRLHSRCALAGGRLQHDARPQDQRLSSRGPSHPALQLLPLSLRQIWNLSRVVVRHSRSPPQGRPTMAPLHLLVKHFSDGILAWLARETEGLSQQSLATRLGCTQQAVARAERFDSNPTLEFVRSWADVLELDLMLEFIRARASST